MVTIGDGTNNKNPTLFQAHQGTGAGPQPAGKGMSGLFCTFSHILTIKDIRTRTALNCTGHGDYGLAKMNFHFFGGRGKEFAPSIFLRSSSITKPLVNNKQTNRARIAHLLAQQKMESMSSSIMSFDFFFTIEMIIYSIVCNSDFFHWWFNAWRDQLMYNHCTEKQAHQRSCHILWICPCDEILYWSPWMDASPIVTMPSSAMGGRIIWSWQPEPPLQNSDFENLTLHYEKLFVIQLAHFDFFQ